MLPPNLRIKVSEETDTRSIVLRACRAMLRPVVRMLLKSGIVHREFLHVTREVYVDVARTEFGLRGRPTSISRTALLTGLARKEVRRIMDRIDSGIELPETSSQDRISRVLSGWFQDVDYVTDGGLPRAIPADGPSPSFADLKSRYGGDIPASAILRELVNTGTVVRGDDGLYSPAYRNYRPNPADPEYILRAGSVIEDIGNTVMRNLYRAEGTISWPERRATNTCLPTSLLPEFRELISTEGQTFLERIDAWLSEHEVKDDEVPTQRVGLGIYIIRDDADK